MAKQDDYARYTIRIPREIYSALEEAAGHSGRSLNAEIGFWLQSLQPEGDNQKMVVNLEKNLAKQLSATAALHDTTPNKLAAGIIEDHLRGKTEDFSYEIRNPDEVLFDHQRLHTELDRLASELEVDFILYYQKLLQMKVFASLIVARGSVEIPKEIFDAAIEINEAAEIEQKVAHRRGLEFISSLRDKPY